MMLQRLLVVGFAVAVRLPVAAPAAGVLRGLADSIEGHNSLRPRPSTSAPNTNAADHAATLRNSGGGGGGGGEVITPPGLEETLSILENKVGNQNWTSVAIKLRDPDNRSYIYGLAMVGCVWLALYGYQILHIWVFLGGFVSAGFFIYTVSTVVFNGEICCGNGDEAETERARVMASLGIGVVAGALAIYALKVGVFLSGTCFGLGLALSTRTVLAHLHVFQTGTSFATFYLISALVGGLLAVYKERPIIVLATSFGGCFGFFICVGYFQDCPFIDTITHVEEAVETHSKSPDNLPECAKVEGILFVATFVLSALFQYGCLCCSSEDDRRCGGCFGCFGGSNGGGGGGSGAFGDFEWATIDDTFGYADEVDYYDAESSTGVGRSRRRQQEKEFRGGEGPSVSRSSRSSRSSNRASFSPAVLRHGGAARPKRNRSGPPPPTGGRDKSVRGGGGGGGSSSVGRFGSSKGTSRSKQLSVNGRKGYARVPATEACSSSSDDDGNHSSESPLRTRSHTRRSRKYRTTSFQ